MITLAVTPVRRLAGLPWLIKLRRMLGLFAFFYASLHFITYIWLDQFFDLQDIVKDVIKRPFITVGFLAFVCLIPLAVTSTNGMVRRLGGKRWQLLHRLVYAHRHFGRGALLVAGQTRHPRAAALRGHTRGVVGRAHLLEMAKAR